VITGTGTDDDVYPQASQSLSSTTALSMSAFEMSLWLRAAAVLLYSGLVHLDAQGPSREPDSERLRYDPSSHHVHPLISKYD
jgi:hypothetical protein